MRFRSSCNLWALVPPPVAGGVAISALDGDTLVGNGGSGNGASANGGTALAGNGGGNVGRRLLTWSREEIIKGVQTCSNTNLVAVISASGVTCRGGDANANGKFMSLLIWTACRASLNQVWHARSQNY